MKRMIVLVAIVLFMLLSTTAQKAQLFVKAGVTSSHFTSENTYNFSEVNNLFGYEVGLLSRLPFNKKIALQPSLQIISKGAKTKGGNPPAVIYDFDATTAPVYLDLPVLLVFDILQLKKSKGVVFVGAGFYGAIGIGGKNKIEGKSSFYGDIKDEMKIDFGKEDEGYGSIHNYAGIGFMNKYDYGISATGGARNKKLLVAFEYEWGLQNVDRGTRANKDINKNMSFSFTFGWQLF